MRGRSHSAALLLAGLVLAACSATPPPHSSGSCAGPILDSEPETASPGGTVEVQGTGFLDGCADAFQNGTPIETESPMSPVELTVTQSDVVVMEATVTIAEDGSFTEVIQLPEDLGTAPVVVSTDATGSQALEITVDR